MRQNAFVAYESLTGTDGEISVPKRRTSRSRVIKGDEAVVSREEVMIGSPANHKPILHVDKRNGVVRSLEVRCTCGQKVQILCQYD